MATKKAEKRTTSKKAPNRKSGAGKGAAAKRGRRKTLTPEALARKIVRVTQNPSKLSIEELYAEDCASFEPGQSDPIVGHEGLRAKFEQWEQFQDSEKAEWTARNVFVKRTVICIEWQAHIVTRDGRTLTFNEVAVHDIKGGKITAERFYYDTAALSGAESAVAASASAPEDSRAAASPGGRDRSRRPAAVLDLGEESGPTVDPIDL